MVTNIDHTKAEEDDSDFYKYADLMSHEVGIEGSMEGVEEMEEWLGYQFLERSRHSIKPPMQGTVERVHEHEDIAGSMGCTFKIKGIIPMAPPEETEVRKKAEYMYLNTKLAVSTMGKPKAQTIPMEDSDILMGDAVNGEHYMLRQEEFVLRQGLFTPSELQGMMDMASASGSICLEFTGAKEHKTKVAIQGLGIMIDRLIKR